MKKYNLDIDQFNMITITDNNNKIKYGIKNDYLFITFNNYIYRFDQTNESLVITKYNLMIQYNFPYIILLSSHHGYNKRYNKYIYESVKFNNCTNCHFYSFVNKIE